MAMNFSSIETTSIVCQTFSTTCRSDDYLALQTFTNTLYDLASRPEFIAPLREDAKVVIAQYGRTKPACWSYTRLIHSFGSRIESGRCYYVPRVLSRDIPY